MKRKMAGQVLECKGFRAKRAAHGVIGKSERGTSLRPFANFPSGPAGPAWREDQASAPVATL